MHEFVDTFGTTMKTARKSMGLTQEQLAERLGKSTRYILALENSYKKPQYWLLAAIIRELNINPDEIFYPEKPTKDSQVEDIVRMLYRCDDHTLSIIRATVKAALETKVGI